MSSINTNISALIANTNLNRSQQSLSQSLERLSTGMRINSGADDPSGLIASEGLQSEMQGINQGISNSTRATNVIATADGALSEVSNLLISIQGLVVQSANSGGLSPDEIQANQLQIDSAIASITRIANSTSFGGLKLLDGSLGYVTSGVATSALQDLDIQNASFGTQSTLPVVVNVLTSARQAQLQFTGSAISNSVSLQIAGNTGVQVLTFTSNTRASGIAFAINSVSDSTGVTAVMTSATNMSSGITFKSTGWGSNQFVSVQTLGDASAFPTQGMTGAIQNRASGRDAVASINGAQAIGDGLHLSVNTAALNMSLDLSASFGLGSKSFTITGGGANFQLGAQVQSNQQVSIAIGSVAAAQLGDAADGYLSDVATGGKASVISGNAAAASNIVTAAINQVSVLRGRLGAFQTNTLQTNINSLQVALENVTSAESSIQDVDFAAETSNLTRAQILTQAGTSVLAQANQTPQTVLTLLK
jgi:flagellin